MQISWVENAVPLINKKFRYSQLLYCVNCSVAFLVHVRLGYHIDRLSTFIW